jgi:hypothetical protein
MIKKMKYQLLNKKEEEKVIIEILDTLLDKSVPFSGKHRLTQWEKGWGENLKEGDVTPKYFGKYKVNRLNGKFVWGISENYEQEMLYTLVDGLTRKYLTEVDTICEFGCGTGHNLHRIKKILPNIRPIGLDWTKASQKLLQSFAMEGYNFDFFNPHFNMPKGSGVITVAALEQTGRKYKRFVSFLLKKKPSIVVHIEPIPELLDPTKLIDYLSIKYMEKRKYLSGYLDYLKELEKQGRIKIIEAKRSGIGSKFIDGYSLIIWKPK